MKTTQEQRAERFTAAKCVDCGNPVFTMDGTRCQACTLVRVGTEVSNTHSNGSMPSEKMPSSLVTRIRGRVTKPVLPGSRSRE